MTKYIVKNCYSFVSRKISGNFMFKDYCSRCGYADKPCKDNTDCPIKQVVELVEAENKLHRKRRRLIPMLNEEILQTLQVEEVE